MLRAAPGARVANFEQILRRHPEPRDRNPSHAGAPNPRLAGDPCDEQVVIFRQTHEPGPGRPVRLQCRAGEDF
jgi:hypothetical protein